MIVDGNEIRRNIQKTCVSFGGDLSRTSLLLTLTKMCVSLGGALSRMSLLFAFTIGQKKSSLSRPVTQSYAKVHNILLLEYLLLDVRSILSKLVQTSRLID